MLKTTRVASSVTVALGLFLAVAGGPAFAQTSSTMTPSTSTMAPGVSGNNPTDTTVTGASSNAKGSPNSGVPTSAPGAPSAGSPTGGGASK